MQSKQAAECGQEDTRVFAMRSMKDYPPGLIGLVSALFSRTISASHGVDWTLDAMIAEQRKCEIPSAALIRNEIVSG